MTALKAGIEPDSLRRPLNSTNVESRKAENIKVIAEESANVGRLAEP